MLFMSYSLSQACAYVPENSYYGWMVCVQVLASQHSCFVRMYRSMVLSWEVRSYHASCQYFCSHLMYLYGHVEYFSSHFMYYDGIYVSCMSCHSQGTVMVMLYGQVKVVLWSNPIVFNILLNIRIISCQDSQRIFKIQQRESRTIIHRHQHLHPHEHGHLSVFKLVPNYTWS